MTTIEIKVHSFIDVITNSSTEIYIGCHDNTVQYAKDLINSILAIAKSDKTADDLFEFEIKDPEYEDEYFDTRTLIIKTKTEDAITIDLSSQLEKIFDVNARYDG